MYRWIVALAVTLFCGVAHSEPVSSVTQYGITWTFADEVESGTFITGDTWVVGPVTVVGISTDLHAPGFTPGPDDNGSMVNPGATGKQGYDGSLGSYDATLNASRPGGRPLSADNPLVLQPHSSLVSMVSWLYRSRTDKEPGIPGFNGGTGAPRPVTRSGAILTVLTEAAPANSFRPPYCGGDKTVRFQVEDLQLDRLKNLAPVGKMPDVRELAGRMSRPWIDHVHEYLGAMVHPSMNMPNYGREMGSIVAELGLAANLDVSAIPGAPEKKALVIPLVQFGIDSTGIADAGGGWPANGGHGLGRKFPILFAGALLDDRHMMEVGAWKTAFQENQQTFYVSQADVDLTHSDKWNPDSRAADKERYTVEDIGMPEWGIRHGYRPAGDNRGWRTPYRSVNGAVIPGFALAIAIMDLKEKWNHDAYLDYACRYMMTAANDPGGLRGTNAPSGFMQAMWQAYAQEAGLTWKPAE